MASSDLPAAPPPEPPDPDQQDREIMDLILSGHRQGEVYGYVQAAGYGDPGEIVFRAVQRFTDQAQSVPTVTQVGFLLDSFRALAGKAVECGDFNGARAILKDYLSVVKFLHAERLNADPEPKPPEVVNG